MATTINVRECGAANFNTGGSVCPLEPRKIKSIILVQHGQTIDDWSSLTADDLKRMCHADRPGRLLPVKTVVECAPNGGEAEVSAEGYGNSKLTGYSEFSVEWTLEDYDAGLKANLARCGNQQLDAYFVNEDNVVFGYDSVTAESDGTHVHVFQGIPLAVVYPGGQDWDSSGTAANLTVTTVFRDYEKYIKSPGSVSLSFDVTEALEGLRSVDLISVDSGYKLVEHWGLADITNHYADALVAAGSVAVTNAASVSYADGVLTLGSVSGAPVLAAPSVLFENDIIGIEQWS